MAHESANKALILAGVRKCGTTTLFHMLARHSLVVPASAKESQFFACDPDTVKSNLDWYCGLFGAKNGAVNLDGSTWYFGAPEAPHLINECLHDARVVICVRDPASRAYSGYLHMKKQTPSKETRSFEDILSATEEIIQQGSDVYEAEDILLNEAVSNGLTDADYISEGFHNKRFGAPFHTKLADKRFSFRYFSESCYSRWLPNWKAVFGARLSIVYFEDLLAEPQKVVQQLLDFSTLPLEEGVVGLIEENKTKLPRNALAGGLLAFRKHNPAGKALARMMKMAGLKDVGGRLREGLLYGSKDCLTENQVKRTRAILKDEYDYWFMADPRTINIWADRKADVPAERPSERDFGL